MSQTPNNSLHVILGTGPVGCWIARSLCARGLPVRAVNRSGHRPGLMPVNVEMAAADLSDPARTREVTAGAAVIYQASGPPYHLWQQQFPALQQAALAAASKHGARYVSIENLYMYGASTSISEDSPFTPCSKKGELRAEMAAQVMQAHRRGEIRACALRSSDYYGPGVIASAFGQMVFGNLVAGKKAKVSGSATLPHSFAYIEDVGIAAATLGTSDEAPGRAWIAPHAPAQTQGEMVATACRLLDIAPRMSVITPMMMRLAGLFVPQARASVEMMYQFTQPFVVDSSQIRERFALAPTAVESGIQRTLHWYQQPEARPGK